MAVGLNLDTEYMRRSSIPSGGAGTLTAGGFADFFAGVWVYRPSATATYALTASAFIIHGQAGAREIGIGFNSAGSNLSDLNLQAIYNSGGGSGTPYSFPLHTGADFLDEWVYYFFYEDASNNQVAGYIRLADLATAITNSRANDNAGSQYINTLTFGNDSGGGTVVLGYYAYARARDSAASAANVLTYANSSATITGDWGFWDLDTNSDTADTSGNGRTLTFNGTLSTETSPTFGGGGTTYNQSVSGSITPAAILAKLTSKLPFGSITITGVVHKQTNKIFVGSITGSGIIRKQTNKIFTGSSTPVGIVVKQTNKQFTGSSTPSGALSAQILFTKAIAGSITAVGTLVKNSAFIRGLSGTITASGIVTKSTLKRFTGSITTVGSLVKQTLKRFTGTVALSGIVTTAFSTLKTIAGSITLSGIVSGFKFTPTLSTVFSAGMRSLRRFIGRR